MDISADEGLSVNFTRRIETARFGLFIFQVGVDERETAMPLQRVADAQARFLNLCNQPLVDQDTQNFFIEFRDVGHGPPFLLTLSRVSFYCGMRSSLLNQPVEFLHDA